MNNKLITSIIIIVLLLGGIIWYGVSTTPSSGPGKLDEFAQCITNSGAKFYGAYWCSHCQAQKKLFDNSAKFLPYIECSTPSGDGQQQVCIDANIESYPTWIFADGSRQSGEVSLDKLAEKTGCVLPTDLSPAVEVSTSTASTTVIK
jgi:thiol-disulfide isomerase/thioredoxin